MLTFICFAFAVPTPAIIFMAVIGGFCLLLLVLYQCLKAGMFFKTDPPERPDEKDYAELGEAYATETDDEYIGPSSKATSRRSSFNTSGSKSDGELALGDSASVYGYPKSSDGEYSPAGARRTVSAYGDGGAIDLRLGQDELVSTAGRIQVSASYAPTAEKLAVTVIRAEDVPSKQRGGAASVQVRLVLMPSKRERFKTKAKSSANPNFHENFTFSRVTQGEIHECGLRFRLYGHERLTRGKLIGEVNISLSEFDLDGDDTPLWRTLTPRSSLSVSTIWFVYNLIWRAPRLPAFSLLFFKKLASLSCFPASLETIEGFIDCRGSFLHPEEISLEYTPNAIMAAPASRLGRVV